MPRVLITGHSFVKRYCDYLKTNFEAKTPFNKALGLPFEEVYIFGKGGLKADEVGLNLILAKSNEVKPEVVLIEIGTNDLSDSDSQVLPTIYHIFFLCTKLFEQGVKKVILCEVIARRKFRGSTTQQQFLTKQKQFNILLNRFPQQHPDIIVWRHQRSKLRNLTKGEISTDNIHITTPKGFKWYNFSIRAAIIKGLKSLQ